MTTWSGTNFTFHSLKAFLRHFCPPLKGHVQSFHKGITHTMQLEYTNKNNSGKLESKRVEYQKNKVVYTEKKKKMKETECQSQKSLLRR